MQSREHATSNRERPVHFREIEGLGDSDFEYTFAVRNSVLHAFSRFSLGGRLPKCIELKMASHITQDDHLLWREAEGGREV